MAAGDGNGSKEIETVDEFMSESFARECCELFTQARSLAERICLLIERCREILPHRDWDRISQLDWRGEPSRMARWTQTELADPAVNGPFRSLYYALGNPIIDDRPTMDVELVMFCPAGAPVDAFDGREPSASPVLDSLYQISYTGDSCLGNNAEYTIGLGYVFYIVPEAIRLVRPDLLFRYNAKRLEITGGFHDGEEYRLGTVTAAKRPRSSPQFDMGPAPLA